MNTNGSNKTTLLLPTTSVAISVAFPLISSGTFLFVLDLGEPSRSRFFNRLVLRDFLRERPPFLFLRQARGVEILRGFDDRAYGKVRRELPGVRVFIKPFGVERASQLQRSHVPLQLRSVLRGG